MVRRLSLLLFCLLLAGTASAQHRGKKAPRFENYIQAGLNMCQIDGDNSGPYNRFHLKGGVGTQFSPAKDPSSHLKMVVELAYSARGSYVTQIDRTIDLSYVEMPLMLAYSADRFRLGAGFAPAILIRSHVEAHGVFDRESSENYRRWDRLPFVADFRYNLGDSWSLGARFQTSLLTIAHESGSGTYRIFRSNKGQFSRFITLSLAYRF